MVSGRRRGNGRSQLPCRAVCYRCLRLTRGENVEQWQTGGWKQILGKRQAATSRKREKSDVAEAIASSERVYSSIEDEAPSAQLDDRVREERYEEDFREEPARSPDHGSGNGSAPTMQDVFGPGGLLERSMIGGYEHRPAQLEMAEVVHDAFTENITPSSKPAPAPAKRSPTCSRRFAADAAS